jgi:NAD(P)-dependent dehydrogenase (short-subunit alcohol dehydrogenase family)
LCDVRDPDAVQRVVDRALADFGRLDVLVNNAGGAPPTDTSTASAKFHKAIIDINLTAPLVFAIKANAVMQGQDGGGSIVNISSMASVVAAPRLVAYGAAKAGLNALTRSLAVEWGPKVRVNCIALGTIMTEALETYVLPKDSAAREAMTAAIPLRRIGEAEEIANVCLFLCSEAAPYIDGSTIWADGGGLRGT